MSWARIDDEAWHHPKFEELQEKGIEGMAAIGLWAMAISLAGEKRSPIVTLNQATMLCGGDKNLASKCFDLLRSSRLFCFDSASKQTVIHDWENYRSKDEAKSYAGRKGGIKSGESRRKKTKANAKQGGRSASKQTRSPVPDPDPVPDPNTRQLVNQVFTAYRKHKQIKETKKRVDLIRRRLKDWTVEQLCQSIDGMFKDDWKDRYKYNDIKYALDEDNIEKFIGFCKEETKKSGYDPNGLMPYHRLKEEEPPYDPVAYEAEQRRLMADYDGEY